MSLHAYILERLNEEGSPAERDLSRIGSNPYKPFYRTLVVVLGWFEDEVDDNPVRLAYDGRKPTLAETKVLLGGAHPWFEDAIAREQEHFEVTYEFVKEAWE